MSKQKQGCLGENTLQDKGSGVTGGRAAPNHRAGTIRTPLPGRSGPRAPSRSPKLHVLVTSAVLPPAGDRPSLVSDPQHLSWRRLPAPGTWKGFQTAAGRVEEARRTEGQGPR